jgi:pilus assembly protein CpaC
MTVGHLPQIELTLQLAEMPRAVARNLSASMGMANMFAPSAPGEAGALPGLIAALEAKGVLRPIARATLTASAGRVTQLPAGSGCATPSGNGIGMDVTPTLADDGGIMVTLRTCLPGKAPGGSDITVTIRLQDGQTLAVPDVLPDLLRDPGAYSSALADEPTLGPLLSSTDYREGRTEVMILITARTGNPGPALSAAGPSLPTSRVMLVSEPTAGTTEAFTLAHPLLK